MKNLKKVLSLALAFAMVLGLCIGASAATDVTALKDWDEVENQSAAILLGAFNIMKGDDEGNFRPNDNVTRAEAAKMISVALWGGSDDVALYNAGNIGGYPDVVSGSWYMGYVNYMTVQTIMKGDESGTFRPNGDVTGYELLKMCLVSLGYSPETEGLTGAGWDVRTMALATKTGFKNLTANTTVTNWSAPLTRTNAAQIIANMIDRETVIYSLTSGVGGNTTSRVVGTESTFGESVLGMKKVIGTLLANEFGTITDKTIDNESRNYKGENAIVEYPAPTTSNPNATKTANIVLSSTAADVGGKVSMYVVNGVATSATVIATEEIAPKFNKADGTITNVDKTAGFELTVSINGTTAKDSSNDYAESDLSTIYTINSNTGAMTVADDAEVKFIDTNNDGYIDTVKAFKYTKKTVASDDAKKTEAGDSYTFADAPTIKCPKAEYDFEAKKGDVVMIAAMPDGNVFSASAKSNHGYVMETVEGKVTRASTDGSTIYIDGVKYGNTKDGLVVGSEGTFHLYANGKVAEFTGKKGEVIADTYAVIYGGKTTTIPGGSLTAGGGNTYETTVAAILEDGTVGEYTLAAVKVSYTYTDSESETQNATATIDATAVDVIEATGDVSITLPDGASAQSPATIANKQLEDVGSNKNYLVKYTLDGKKITIIDPVEIGTDGLDASDFDGNVTVGTKTITSKTVGFVQTVEDGKDEKWTITKGVDLAKKVEGTGNVTAVYSNLFKTDGTSDDLAVSYMVITNGLIKGETKTSDLYYVLSNPEITAVAAGKNTYVATVFNGSTGKVEELSWKATSTTVKAGDKYTAFDENTGLSTALSHNKPGFIGGIVDSLLNVVAQDGSTVGTYTLTKDTKYYVINGEDSATGAISDLAVQTAVAATTGTNYQVEVVVAMNGEAETTTATMVIIYAEIQHAQ